MTGSGVRYTGDRQTGTANGSRFDLGELLAHHPVTTARH